MTAADARAQRLVLVLWSCGPDRPGGATLAAAPFVYALSARAFEIAVEMHFTSSTVRWLLPGVAEQGFTDAAQTRRVADYLTEAEQAGVQLYACGMAMAEHVKPTETLRPSVKRAGAATVIGSAFTPGARTLVF